MSKYLQALRVEQSKTFSDPSFALILLGLTAAMAIFPGLICHALSSDIASSDNSTARMYVFSFAGRIGYLAPLIVGIISFGADFKNGGFARMIMVYGSRFIAYIRQSNKCGLTLNYAGSAQRVLLIWHNFHCGASGFQHDRAGPRTVFHGAADGPCLRTLGHIGCRARCAVQESSSWNIDRVGVGIVHRTGADYDNQ